LKARQDDVKVSILNDYLKNVTKVVPPVLVNIHTVWIVVLPIECSILIHVSVERDILNKKAIAIVSI
jgi:hypothetical protein